MAKHDDHINVTNPLSGLSPEHLAALAQVFQAANNQGDKHGELIAAITKLAESSQQIAVETKRQTRFQNAEATGLSPFDYDSRCEQCRTVTPHADGRLPHPKPALKYRTFFCFNKQTAESLTPLEVELFNSFTESRTARHGTWKADLGRDGNIDALSIEVPFVGGDNRGSLPSLAQILTELLTGEPVPDAVNLVAELAALRQKVAELDARQPVGA